MQVHIGHYISGAAHAGFILWVLFGGAFRPEPIPFEVTDVAVISEQEFLALSATASAPEISDTVTPLTVPNDPEPEQVPPAAPDPDAAPVVKPQPRPQPPADPLPNAPQRDAPPAPKPIDRVAPEPVAPPPPDVAEADTAQDSVSLTGDTAADTPQDQQEAAAPQEAVTEIVTEATPKPSGAPSTSLRPRKRPAQLAQVSDPDPAPQPTPEPAPEQDAKPPVDQQSVNDALAAALADTQSDTPSGPPLSFSEREAFRASVQQCWNLDDGSLWARVTVTVAMTLDRNGKVDSEPKLVASQGGSESDTQIAFQAARRAIYLCQKSGYSLPADKYDQWREIEITFNPNN